MTVQSQELIGSDDAKTAKSRPSREGRERSLLGLYLLTLVLGIALWYAGAAWGGNPLIPTPLDVVIEGWSAILDGSLWANTSASLARVLLGFSLGVAVAIPAGFLMGWYWLARGLVEPWVQFFRTVPPLALIPLVIVILGIGEDAKIFVIFLAAFLACVLATFQGVRNVDITMINAARVLGAKDLTIFARVVVPASTPFIFVGMRVALGSAWATLVASELIAAPTGLGRMMQSAAQFLQTDRIVVGIVMIGLLGFVMDRALLLLERRLTAWQEVRA
ncbi:MULTISPECIES: ABC transporter permease [Microcella]|uniref:ABC transporter permease n=1 Tax=Microcella TaxID=337004 RepID=UPI0015CF6790|nr:MULTISPECIES: ABC transporter permease [Microcella]QOD93068.1 ABC transporter permease [Chryseoglobus sp. 28M-23]